MIKITVPKSCLNNNFNDNGIKSEKLNKKLYLKLFIYKFNNQMFLPRKCLLIAIEIVLKITHKVLEKMLTSYNVQK